MPDNSFWFHSSRWSLRKTLRSWCVATSCTRTAMWRKFPWTWRNILGNVSRLMRNLTTTASYSPPRPTGSATSLKREMVKHYSTLKCPSIPCVWCCFHLTFSFANFFQRDPRSGEVWRDWGFWRLRNLHSRTLFRTSIGLFQTPMIASLAPSSRHPGNTPRPTGSTLTLSGKYSYERVRRYNVLKSREY